MDVLQGLSHAQARLSRITGFFHGFRTLFSPRKGASGLWTDVSLGAKTASAALTLLTADEHCCTSKRSEPSMGTGAFAAKRSCSSKFKAGSSSPTVGSDIPRCEGQRVTDEAIQSVDSLEGTREGAVDFLPPDVTLYIPGRAASEVRELKKRQAKGLPCVVSMRASLRARTYVSCTSQRRCVVWSPGSARRNPPGSVAIISRSVCLSLLSRQSWSHISQRILVIRAVTTKDSRGSLRVLLSAVVIQSQTKIPDGQHLSASYDIFG